jgi:hypothetical protein
MRRSSTPIAAVACLALASSCAKGTGGDAPSVAGFGGQTADSSVDSGAAGADAGADAPETETGGDTRPSDTSVGPEAGPDADASPPKDAPDADAVPAKDAADAADGAADAAADGPANPCQGLVCDKPPPNTCADPTHLTVYNPSGTCDQGTCNYGSHQELCQYGCSQNTCAGNPCLGVTCNKPPPNTCADPTHLTVHDVPGTCDQGTCKYSTHTEFCNFGCVNDVCNGDPCTGVVCNKPLANYCTDATHLEVYETPGTCKSGACTYGHHNEFCTFGCSLGICQGDPCTGVTCTSPPASYCKDAGTLHKYTGGGTCVGGTCQYAADDLICKYGCLGGVCKNCQVNADCAPAGQWCDNGTCKMCITDAHCGQACTNCTALNPVQICDANGSACVQCTIDSQCGPGKWCNNKVCAACNTAQHCGTTCAACSGNKPDCSGSACVCNATSCGAGAACSGGSCVPCTTPASCGPSCVACSGTTPSCGGATVGCQCTTSPDSCGGTTSWCNAGTCAACGSGSCGNGRCDCGETTGTCAADCGPPCPTALSIATWNSGADGWSWDGLWRRHSSGYMVAGSTTSYSSSYTQNLTYGTNVNLSGCTAATLAFSVRLDDDPSYSNKGPDKSERLYVQCSGDAGANWTNLTPNPWPANQSACATSYCCGGPGSGRSFPWTAQTIALPAGCRTATVRFRFQAKGQSAWNLMNPGWFVDTVTVN